MTALIGPIQGLGAQVCEAFTNAWSLLMFSVDSVAAVARFFSRQGFWAAFRVSLQQVHFTGLEALPFLSLLSLLIGFTVIVQSLPQLQGMGAHGLIGKIRKVEVELPAGTTGAPMTYMHDGTQFIVVAIGGSEVTDQYVAFSVF